MRRLAIVAAALACLTGAPGQIWEKRVAPGVVYREEIERAVPRIVHSLRISLKCSSLRAEPELAGEAVFDDTVTKGRDTVTHMVQRTKAIAGINADFFHVPYTGDPLGLFLKAGRLDSVPTFPRAVLAWGEEGATFALPTWTGKVILPGGAGLPLDGINELATGDRVTLDTPATGFVLASGPNTALLLRSPSASWGAECDADLEISEVVKDLTKRSLGPGEAALVASGSSEAALVRAAVGQRIRIHWQTDGLDWRQYPNAVGGGPFLVRAGKLAIDWKEERFRDALALKRHPRSAVGLTPMGDLVLVAVDGRQAFSDGASLDELAAIVLRLGCVDAMNLDGGGSTCLSLGGLALNRPSDGTERPVADAILVFTEGAKGSGSAPQFALKGPPNIAIGGEGAFSLLRDGKAVPNAVIFWSAAGSAWVDQGGILHPIAVGDANLTAWLDGNSVTIRVPVRPKPAPKPAAKPKRKPRHASGR